MSEFPDDIKKDAEEAVAGFVGWVEGGNTTASLSEHAVAGLKHSFAYAILAERERCMLIARDWPLAGLINTNDENPQSIFASGARAQGRTIAEIIMKGGAA